MLTERWLVGFALVGCGPLVDLPEGDGSDGADSAPPPESSTVGSVGAGTDGESGPEGPGTEGPDEGPDVDDGSPPPDLPPDAGPSLCDDPYAVSANDIDPYLHCLRGVMQFSFISSPSVGVGFGAYAQFYDVSAESQVVWDEEILDPFEGIGDCELRQYGNSGYGETEQVVWEDAGDVTFALGGTELLATEYGDPVSVIGYEGEADDAGIAPVFLGAYGLVATGDTTPPFDLPNAVTLPEPIIVQSPSLAGEAVDHEDFVFEWEPSDAGTPFEISVNVRPEGWDYTIFCRVDDDGEFAIPVEITGQLPLPHEAHVYLRRADIRVVGWDGRRGILATASAATNGDILLQ